MQHEPVPHKTMFSNLVIIKNGPKPAIHMYFTCVLHPVHKLYFAVFHLPQLFQQPVTYMGNVYIFPPVDCRN